MKSNKKYLKNHFTCLLVVILFSFFLYAFKLTHYSFSIDTECIINDSTDLLRSWYGIGRYGLCIFKELFHTLPINITLTNFLSILFLSICAYLWIYFFELILQRKLNVSTRIIGMLLIVSSPIMMEQIGFVLQSTEIMIGFCLSALGCISLVHYHRMHHPIYLICSFIFIFITFSFYQAFILLYISCVILYLICKYKDDKIDNKTIILDIFKNICIFFFVFLLYSLLNKYILNTLHLDKTSYLTSKYLWGSESLQVILKNIITNTIKVYSGYYNCYHPFFTIFSLLFIYSYALKDKRDYWKLLLTICLFLVPVTLIVITGSDAAGRSQFSIIITLAFYVVYFLEFYDKRMMKFISIILILFQSTVTLYLQISAQNVFNLDKQLSITITDTIKEDHLEDKKIAIVGNYNPNHMLKGEVLGHSFFEWDNFDGKSSNGRIHGFFKCIGLNNQFVFDQQLPECYDFVKGKESFLKNKQLYVKDDIVIVKLYQ